jgi:hypothetical protein
MEEKTPENERKTQQQVNPSEYRRSDGDFDREKHKLVECKNQLVNGEAR